MKKAVIILFLFSFTALYGQFSKPTGAVTIPTYSFMRVPADSSIVIYQGATNLYNQLWSRHDTVKLKSLATNYKVQAGNAGKKYYHGIQTIGAYSFNNTSHVFTVASGGLTYWNQGTKYTTTSAVTVDIDDATLVTNKLYFIYFSDATGVLRVSQTPWNWYTHTFVATLFWNGSEGAIQDEDHTYTRNIDWQKWAHYTIGTRYSSGLSLTAPTTANDATLSIGSGTIYDEDQEITISPQSTMRGWYKTSSLVMTYSNYSFPYLGTSGAPLYLDTDTYTLTTFASNRFAVYWLYASNDVTRPIYVIPSHVSTTYTTIANARSEVAPDLSLIPINAEMKIIYKVIYSGDGQFQESTDYRGSSPLPAGGSSSTTAGAVSFSPYGTITQTTVQKALEEFNDSTFKNLTQYYVPKYNNKNFIKSQIYANTTGVGINNIDPQQPIEVTATGTGDYVPIAAFYAPNNNLNGFASQYRFGAAGSTGNSAEFRFIGNGANNAGNRLDFGFWGYATPAMSITLGTKVGIGTINPSEKLHVVGKIQADSLIKGYDIQTNNRYFIGSSSGSAGQTIISAGAGSATWGNPIVLTTNDTTGVATYTGSTRTLNIPNYKTRAYVPYAGATANVSIGSYTMTASNFCLSSDRRLKTDIHYLHKSDYLPVNFVSYRMKSEPNLVRYGVIAQDIERVNPELVQTDEQGIKSVSYIDLLILKVAELEDRVRRLENRHGLSKMTIE
jgi:hypothetical protein